MTVINEEISLEDLMNFRKYIQVHLKCFLTWSLSFFWIWIEFIHVSLDIFKIFEKVIQFRFQSFDLVLSEFTFGHLSSDCT